MSLKTTHGYACPGYGQDHHINVLCHPAWSRLFWSDDHYEWEDFDIRQYSYGSRAECPDFGWVGQVYDLNSWIRPIGPVWAGGGTDGQD